MKWFQTECIDRQNEIGCHAAWQFCYENMADPVLTTGVSRLLEKRIQEPDPGCTQVVVCTILPEYVAITKFHLFSTGFN